ncbi:MAG TPA: hypothetical protein PK404_04675 [Fervidobacterium sp.]|nr:hypothetical protein [Fervidobacterium sp.]
MNYLLFKSKGNEERGTEDVASSGKYSTTKLNGILFSMRMDSAVLSEVIRCTNFTMKREKGRGVQQRYLR